MKGRRGLLEIRFRGRGVKPDGIRARDLAEVVKALEDAVLSFVRDGDGPGILKEGAGLSLVDIRSSSVGLRFAPHMEEAINPAFIAFAEAVNTSEDVLQPKTRKNVTVIKDFCSRYKARAELRDKPSSRSPLATIHPHRIIPPAISSTIGGETVLYGVLEDVGGVQPKAWIRVSGERVGFTIDQEQARTLGPKLYTMVGVRGVAQWDVVNKVITGFSFLELTNYKPKPLSQAIEALRESFGKYIDQIDDLQTSLDKQRKS